MSSAPRASVTKEAAVRALKCAAECAAEDDLAGAVSMAALAAHLMETDRPEALFGSRFREKASVG